MPADIPPQFSVFQGSVRLVSGTLAQAALAVRAAGSADGVMVFDDQTGRVIDIDTRGDEAEVLARLEGPAEPARRPGRPKLGVVAREVTLLPRHWDWLAAQPGGASVALRKLVESARRDDAAQARQSRDAAYRFMSAIGGDLPGFEAAARALYAGAQAEVSASLRDWPEDLRDHALRLAFPTAEAAASPAPPGP